MADVVERCDADERLSVWRWRFDEAVRAGLTDLEARLFAESDSDLGELRRLVKAGCPLEQLRQIVL